MFEETTVTLVFLLHVSARLGHHQGEHKYKKQNLLKCYIQNYCLKLADILRV
jgi:hypothetical protein